MAKVRIKQNRYDNWVGYIGRNKVMEFGLDETRARKWYSDQLFPKQTYGYAVNPDTGAAAPDGRMWCRNALTGTWFLEADRTPFHCSPASETYWTS